MTNKICVAVAMITNSNNELLVARKMNAEYYTLPGGKIDAGETATQSLIRELDEELNLQFTASDFESLGRHSTQAANEKNTFVEGYIFRLKEPISQPIRVRNEIEDTVWLTKDNYPQYKLAHLLKEFALSRWLK